MGYRDFCDAAGVRWHAWDVMPQLVERRQGGRRQARELATGAADRRRGIERRLVTSRRSTLNDGFDQGWLCFENETEKRRLIPIPDDWMRCREARLAEYCREASPVHRTAAGRVRLPSVDRPTIEAAVR